MHLRRPESNEKGAANPKAGRFIALARILRPQGRRGEVVAELTTDFPERFQKINRVFIEDGVGSPRSCKLDSAWLHKGRIVLKLAGIDSISQAEGLRGLPVLIPFEERVRLPEGSYYWAELEGCQVVTGPLESRSVVGTVTGIEVTGAAPLLHVSRAQPQGEVLIPLAQEICHTIDPAAKLIVIDPPEDLLELNERPSRSPLTMN